MMSAVTEDKVDRKEGKRFKLVVRSAEEAVRVIREKLGEDARVLSVKQVGGEGLKRFISSPKRVPWPMLPLRRLHPKPRKWGR
jgi:predicted DNA-binding antitoxin AbrB/MazE fold protein